MDNNYSALASAPIVKPTGPFDERFDANTPNALRRLSERLCRSYGINGICDPMYIANVIAFELEIGDGQGHFGDPSTWTRCEKPSLCADDIIRPCALVINHQGYCQPKRMA